MTEQMYTPPPITGYRELSQSEIDAMNECKSVANSVGALCDKVAEMPDVDRRWAAIGKTELQQGFMALIRAIAKPTSFLFAIIALTCTSCLATSGDIQRIADKQREGEQAIAATVAQMQAGLASATDVTEAIEDAWGNTAHEIEAVAEDIKERGEGLLDEALVAALTTLTGGVGLNMYRNRTRAAVLKKS